MAEPWTQEQLEIERAREARRRINKELLQIVLMIVLAFTSGFFIGRAISCWDGVAEEKTRQEKLVGGAQDV